MEFFGYLYDGDAIVKRTKLESVEAAAKFVCDDNGVPYHRIVTDGLLELKVLEIPSGVSLDVSSIASSFGDAVKIDDKAEISDAIRAQLALSKEWGEDAQKSQNDECDALLWDDCEEDEGMGFLV